MTTVQPLHPRATDVSSSVSANEASELTGVPSSTLRRWARTGLVSCLTLPNGQIRFLLEDLDGIVRYHPAKKRVDLFSAEA